MRISDVNRIDIIRQKYGITVNAIMANQYNQIGVTIGNSDLLPWSRCPTDMDFFVSQTTGNIVVMGSKTYFSLPASFRPLKNRYNIVYSKKADEYNDEYRHVENLRFVSSHTEALDVIDSFNQNRINNDIKPMNIWCIGGKQIYQTYINAVNSFLIINIPGNWPINPRIDTLAKKLGEKPKFVTRGKTFNDILEKYLDYDGTKIITGKEGNPNLTYITYTSR